jgi:hypothetical protein
MGALKVKRISKLKQFIADLLDVAGFPDMRLELEQHRQHLEHLDRVKTGHFTTKEYK